MAAGDIYYVKGGLKGRNAVAFIGGDSDDYLQVDAHGAARVLAGDTTGTYAGWINVADVSGTYTIFGNGDDNVVEFLEINVEAGVVTVRCTDNTTAQFVSAVDKEEITPHVWHHIAVVQKADGTGVHVWVDGEEQDMDHSTDTNLDAWFGDLGGIDTSRIGAANKAGDASVTQELAGAVGRFKYWNTALTDEQIINEYMNYGEQVDLKTNLMSDWYFSDSTLYTDEGDDGADGTEVGQAMLVNNYSEFTSRLKHSAGSPVVADDISCFADGDTGYAVVVKAA